MVQSFCTVSASDLCKTKTRKDTYIIMWPIRQYTKKAQDGTRRNVTNYNFAMMNHLVVVIGSWQILTMNTNVGMSRICMIVGSSRYPSVVSPETTGVVKALQREL